MLSIVIRNMKDIDVSEERALSSFLEGEVNVFLRNVDTSFPDYTLLYRRTPHFDPSLPLKSETLK